MQDRYGNHRTTTSTKALEHYCLGVDLYLAAQPGSLQAFSRAVELDPTFAVAHAALARSLQIKVQPIEAQAAIEQALALQDGLPDSERAHVSIMNCLVAGRSEQALAQVRRHVQSDPRDVMVVQPGCGVFGMIGFSGRVGREAENLAFMESIAPHFADDWWFDSQMAFSLCEVGQLAKADRLIEKAYSANPSNAHAVHHRAHIHYETGERQAGLEAVSSWRAGYDQRGLLHCHLAWHDALWQLEAGNLEEVWRIVACDIHPDRATAPPLNVATDMIALLLRAQLQGHTPDPSLWRAAADYTQGYFATPGISFADFHSAIAYAMTERREGLAQLRSAQTGTATAQVRAAAHAFTAFVAADWQGVIDALTPIMATHECLGGSRAQRDLLELSYAYALVRLGASVEADRFLRLRRPLTTRLHQPALAS